MHRIQVKSRQGNYRIAVGRGILKEAGAEIRRLGHRGRVFILTQRKIASRHLAPLQKSLRAAGYQGGVVLVPDGEKAKSPESLQAVYRALLREGVERRDWLLALGGGVVGDLGGFAASTYQRGIGFVNAATTLLAQVDSAIGGKTAVNLPEGKNLIGTFWPPRLVLSDVLTLKTLPRRELTASLAEVVKYGVIRDRTLFRLLEKQAEDISAEDDALMETLVLRSSRIKAGVVSRDEFETLGERMILNYGHTFGHAFEKAAGYGSLLHGEAVSIGMICAARAAVKMGFFSSEEEKRQARLLEALGLPVRLETPCRVNELVEAMMRDKKKAAGKIRFILPRAIGRVEVRDDVPAGLVKQVFKWAGAGSGR